MYFLDGGIGMIAANKIRLRRQMLR